MRTASLFQEGLITAHAGKTAARLPSLPPQSAHPHSRGKNFSVDAFNALMPGSSQLTRGKHLGRREDRVDLGFIPAHAGKTPSSCQGADRQPAHPRSRGENWQRDNGVSPKQGSSQLTRGKLNCRNLALASPGLIPAHAGKTTSGDGQTRPPGAHPRSRGENAG